MAVHSIQCRVNKHLPGCHATRRSYAQCQRYITISICTVWYNDVTNTYPGVIHVDGVMYNVEFNSFGLIHINFKITIKVKTYKLMHIPSIIFGTLIFDHVYNIFEL